MAAVTPAELTAEEVSANETDSAAQSMSQEEEWEDLADTKVWNVTHAA